MVAGMPHPVDVYVGSRVRLRRTLKGMSQQRLAEAIGLTFQQIQKYERGVNRIGCSRLFELSEVLDVPPSFFFDGASRLSEGTTSGSGAGPGMAEQQPEPYEARQFARREILELVRAYDRIADPEIRKRVFEMVKAVAAFTEPQ